MYRKSCWKFGFYEDLITSKCEMVPHDVHNETFQLIVVKGRKWICHCSQNSEWMLMSMSVPLLKVSSLFSLIKDCDNPDYLRQLFRHAFVFVSQGICWPQLFVFSPLLGSWLLCFCLTMQRRLLGWFLHIKHLLLTRSKCIKSHSFFPMCSSLVCVVLLSFAVIPGSAPSRS